MPDIALLYATYPDAASARTAAKALIEAKLAACCNILPAGESLYRWNGALTAAPEYFMLCKTTAGQAEAAMASLAATHPYECPAILRFSADATAPFAAWIAAETVDPAKSDFPPLT